MTNGPDGPLPANGVPEGCGPLSRRNPTRRLSGRGMALNGSTWSDARRCAMGHQHHPFGHAAHALHLVGWHAPTTAQWLPRAGAMDLAHLLHGWHAAIATSHSLSWRHARLLCGLAQGCWPRPLAAAVAVKHCLHLNTDRLSAQRRGPMKRVRCSVKRDYASIWLWLALSGRLLHWQGPCDRCCRRRCENRIHVSWRGDWSRCGCDTKSTGLTASLTPWRRLVHRSCNNCSLDLSWHRADPRAAPPAGVQIFLLQWIPTTFWHGHNPTNWRRLGHAGRHATAGGRATSLRWRRWLMRGSCGGAGAAGRLGEHWCWRWEHVVGRLYVALGCARWRAPRLRRCAWCSVWDRSLHLVRR